MNNIFFEKSNENTQKDKKKELGEERIE